MLVLLLVNFGATFVTGPFFLASCILWINEGSPNDISIYSCYASKIHIPVKDM